jgi:hypothetical protein
MEQVGAETSQEEACSHSSCQEVQQSSHCRPGESSRRAEVSSFPTKPQWRVSPAGLGTPEPVSERSIFASKARKSKEEQ